MQPPSPSPAPSGSSTTAPTPSGYASDDDDDLIGNDDDSLDGEGGGGIDEADDEDRIPEELLLKYANEAGLEKGRVSTLTLARVLLKSGYPSFHPFVLSYFHNFS